MLARYKGAGESSLEVFTLVYVYTLLNNFLLTLYIQLNNFVTG